MHKSIRVYTFNFYIIFCLTHKKINYAIGLVY
jgi:hypothetical protein